MYAEHTRVPIAQTRTEIERLLSKHKASQYLTAVDEEHGRALVQFKLSNRVVKFELALPEKTWVAEKYQQALRQRWRALLLVLKAKLEAIENKISTFDSEFLAHIVVTDDGRTVGDVLAPEIERIYTRGLMLPAGDARLLEAAK